MSRWRFWGRRDRLPVVEYRRSNPLRFGIVLLIVLAVALYFGFTKSVPFTHGYRIDAVFPSAQNVLAESPVRTAGVTVGKVLGVRREGDVGVLSMEISNDGLPIHRDATMKILPRLFLEGSWFVELRPGTPSSPTLPSGSTIPITQTADPVQLDQVLNALNGDTRANLQRFLEEYGTALTHKPTAAEDVTQAPAAKGLSGAQALKEAARYAPGALRGGAIVQQALRGVEANDLSKLVSGTERFTAGLNSDEQALGEWVDHFNTFLGAFASESSSLKAAVAQLPGALRSARTAFAALRGAIPPIESFSNTIVPGVQQTGPTVAAAMPWITQTERLLQQQSLGGVARALSQATPQLAALIGGQKEFFKQNDLFSTCLTKAFYPAIETTLNDGKASTGGAAYKEFWYALAGFAGMGQNFDGNGHFPRFLVGSGGHTIVSAPTSLVGVKGTGAQVIGHAMLQPEGTRPRMPAAEPPYKPLVPCHTQKVPNLNGPLAQGPADGSGG